MSKKKRTQYVIDQKFQISISIKAIVLPLVTTLAISGVLLYVAGDTNRLIDRNNSSINAIVDNQDTMIDMFLSTPALQQSNNPTVRGGVQTFKENIGKLHEITRNSSKITRNSDIVFYILIVMTVLQTIIIFSLFIFFSHKISGPIMVMRNFMRDIREGKKVNFRPLRKNDELKEFYEEFRETVEYLTHHHKR